MLILIYALLRKLLPQGINVFTVYCHNSKLKLMAPLDYVAFTKHSD